MASAFDTGISSAQTAVLGYVASATPMVAAVSVALLGIKYLRKFVRGA